MDHATLYLQLAEGSGEPGPDQRSKPRMVLAALCATLMLFATPMFWSGSAFGESGPGSSGTEANDCATREDNSGPGSCDDEEGEGDGTTTGSTGDVTTTGDVSTTSNGATTSATATQSEVTADEAPAAAVVEGQKEEDAAAAETTETSTSNRRGTTRTRTTTGGRQKKATTRGANNDDDSGASTTSDRRGSTRTGTSTGRQKQITTTGS